MGTNYYIRENEIPLYSKKNNTYVLHRVDYDEIHIGKLSYGWEFMFQSQPGKFTSFDEFKQYIKIDTGKLYNEYGEEIAKNEMLDIILHSKKHDNLNHIDWCAKEYPGQNHGYKDKAGWSFCQGDFS